MRELNYIDEAIEKNENPALHKGSVERSALSTVYLMNCIEGMKQFPDKIFDLAVVDPPYGLGADKIQNGKKGKNGYVQYKATDWDNNIPTEEYFIELMRVSKNQIIWGGNYMTDYLPPKMCWLIWNKMQRNFDLADGEMAWTSFDKAMRIYDLSRGQAIQENNIGLQKFHPTAKPISLFEWIFSKFTSEGDLILDTHLGSQSSRIAANKAGLDFVGFEIDRDYYNKANSRFKNFVSQTVLF